MKIKFIFYAVRQLLFHLRVMRRLFYLKEIQEQIFLLLLRHKLHL